MHCAYMKRYVKTSIQEDMQFCTIKCGDFDLFRKAKVKIIQMQTSENMAIL